MFSRAPLIAATVLAAWLMACGPTPAQVNSSGHGLYQTADYPAALDAYQRSLEQSPRSGEPHYNSGNALYRMEEYEASLESYDESLKLAENELRSRGFFNRGNASFQREEYAAAVESYKEVLRMNPNDLDAKHNLELALKQSSSRNPDEELEEQEDQEQDQQLQERQEDQEQDQQLQERQEDQVLDQPLTVEQARHMLESVGESAQTFQQKRGQVLISPKPPSEFDW